MLTDFQFQKTYFTLLIHGAKTKIEGAAPRNELRIKIVGELHAPNNHIEDVNNLSCLMV